MKVFDTCIRASWLNQPADCLMISNRFVVLVACLLLLLAKYLLKLFKFVEEPVRKNTFFFRGVSTYYNFECWMSDGMSV